ncbi:MAG TPA: hypothetical protein VGS22_23230 [Thermoanaerobaculia bacterium]|jgi:hypothetical protein|nr:hypothetical protein [Thermoanaerobaculia bacterium]
MNRSRLLVPALLVAAFANVYAVDALETNTQASLPNGLQLADVDGDKADDFVQVVGHRLFVSRVNYDKTGILHHYFSSAISRLIVGRFGLTSVAVDQLCMEFADGNFECYASLNGGKGLTRVFSQKKFSASGEELIVGNFDGDSMDDILLYKPSTGVLRMFTRATTGVFEAMRGFALGNLAGISLVSKQIRAGEFGQTAGRSDLLVFDADLKRVSRFDSVTDSSGKKTFWWAFTAYTGATSSTHQVTVANVEGGALDAIVLRDKSTGAYAFRRAAFAGTALEPITSVLTGQLPVTTASGTMAFAMLKGALTEPGSTRREDLLFFNSATKQVIRTDARYDGAKYTYWWAFMTATPENVGWPAVTKDKWVVLLCKFKGDSSEPKSTGYFRELFGSAGAGLGGVPDYFRDISYGKIDTAATEVKGWYSMPITLATAQATFEPTRDRLGVINACVSASKVSVSSYRSVVAVINADIGEKIGSGAAGGRVLIDPWGLETDRGLRFVVHEMLHGYGLDESYDDKGNVYGDPWDIMSAMRVRSFTGFGGGKSGPELNAPFKSKLGYLPSGRVLGLFPGPVPKTQQVTVAAINRPEANGSLMVWIPVYGDSTGSYYAVELRQTSGWDAGIGGDTVLIHKVVGGTPQLQTSSGGPAFLPGMTFSAFRLSIAIDAIDAKESTARLTITY